MDMNIEELLEAPFKKEEVPGHSEFQNRRPLYERPLHHPPSAAPAGDFASSSPHPRPPSIDDRDSSHRSKRRRSRSRSSRRHRRSSRSLSPSSRRSSRRHRSRSRGEHRRDKDRDRSRSSHRRSDRDREREKERDRRRSPHSTERDSRRRSDSKDKDRRSRRDDGLRYPVLSEAERDRRTVFIMQLAARVRSSDIADFFSAAGKVRDVRLITDRVTRKSKGVGYVEFYEEEAVGAALAMAGQKLLGIPIIVQPTESEKNRIAAEAEVAAAAAALMDKTGAPSNIFTRLYVGSLHFSLTEEDIKTLFEVYGPLDFVTLHKDETGRSKGFAFVQYKSAEHAKVALEKMHGYELKGRQLKVGLSTDKGATFQSDLNGGSLMDDDEKQGFTMSSHARVSLMAKLARAEDGLLIDNSPRSQPVTSRCVLLKNMFDPATETEPGWEQEIEDDVKSECAKFGKVVHGAIDRDSEGHVYLKFDSIPFAQNAINALNGRFFAGKQIQASFIPDSTYNSRYPEAAFL